MENNLSKLDELWFKIKAQVIKTPKDREAEKLAKERLYIELFVAYTEARLGKRDTRDEHGFEKNAHLILRCLRDELWLMNYKPLSSSVHIIHLPVIREIFTATFVDRVVHHWIYNNIADWNDKRFINDSYSCRKGKGTLYGIERLDHFIRKVSHNYAIPTYAIQLDIQGYFMSINRKLLYMTVIENLDKQFEGRKDLWKYKILKYAIHAIVFDDPVKGVRIKSKKKEWNKLPHNKSLFWQPSGVGIVIGNLTSQLFSNVFLDKLDKYIYYELGYHNYGRYVDDFFIIVTEDQLEKAKKDIEKIRKFLENMGLTLHPNKTRIRRIENGVPFLGAVVYPGRIVCGKRVQKNMREAMYQLVNSGRKVESIQSYIGHIMHYDSVRMTRKMLNQYGITLEKDWIE